MNDLSEMEVHTVLKTVAKTAYADLTLSPAVSCDALLHTRVNVDKQSCLAVSSRAKCRTLRKGLDGHFVPEKTRKLGHPIHHCRSQHRRSV